MSPNKKHIVGPPLIRPPLGNGKSGLIGGVVSREGYIKYNYADFVLRNRGLTSVMVRMAIYRGTTVRSVIRF